MGIFGKFPNEDAKIEKDNGSILGPYKTIFAGDTIIITDSTADIEEGDVILRKLPNGKDERSITTNVKFFQKMHSIPAHYQVKFQKESSKKMDKKSPQNITIHGAQSVQIGDFNTQNVINSIQSLKNQIESSTGSPEEKEEAKSLLNKFISHPLVASILGAAVGTIMG